MSTPSTPAMPRRGRPVFVGTERCSPSFQHFAAIPAPAQPHGFQRSRIARPSKTTGIARTYASQWSLFIRPPRAPRLDNPPRHAVPVASSFPFLPVFCLEEARLGLRGCLLPRLMNRSLAPPTMVARSRLPTGSIGAARFMGPCYSPWPALAPSLSIRCRPLPGVARHAEAL